MQNIEFNTEWPYAYQEPMATGVLRQQVSDFQVVETLNFEPCGDGDHVYLFIEKRDSNTEFVARMLGKFCQLPIKEIGYAGLKDRRAITRQWFSVYAPHSDPDWSQLQNDEFSIVQVTRDQKKLKRGAIAFNAFQLVLRDWQGDQAATEQRLQAIAQYGVPNYFGEQRFGRHGNNIRAANRMLLEGTRIKKRHLRSLYFSAARSYVFNLILAERVRQDNWREPIENDVMSLSGCNSYFSVDDIDESIQQRCNSGDISPSAPLIGAQEFSDQSVTSIEQTITQQFQPWQEGLAKAKVKQARRSLICAVDNLEWQFVDDSLQCQFRLASGCYATSVLREVVNYSTYHVEREGLSEPRTP